MSDSTAQREYSPTSLTIVNILFHIVGFILTAYLAAVALGMQVSSAQHYSTFVLGIVTLAALLAFRNLLRESVDSSRRNFYALRVTIAFIGMILAITSFGYIRFHAARLEVSQPFFEGFDVFIGFLMIGGVIILNWIHWGWLLSSITLLAIFYFFFGSNIDNLLFSTPAYDIEFVLNYLGLGTTQGFFWLAQLASDSIYFLVLYAAVLVGIGIMEMVHEAGKAGGRRLSGGAAFASLFGSGIVGAVMGQAVSNVVLSGRMTIPMMKKYGYRSSMAAAIEATASTAGQILPPILGLAGFLIASFLNRPYIEVALAALIPGLLYLTGVLICILVYAAYHKLPKITEEVSKQALYRLIPTFTISFGLVIWLLLSYRSPAIAGLAGISSALLMSAFQGPFRPKLRSLLAAADEGLVLVTILSLLLITVGGLGQTVMTTNLSGSLGTALIQYLPDSQIIMLIGAMLISIILGLGLPTPVAYLVASLAMVPFLQQIGVSALVAHFFVFYFAVFSTLTPPIAISILAASKIADARFGNAAVDAMKMAITTFIVPFAFVYNPDLLKFPELTSQTWISVGEVIFIQGISAVAVFGYLVRRLGILERVGFALSACFAIVAMITGSTLMYFASYGLFLILLVWINVSIKRNSF